MKELRQMKKIKNKKRTRTSRLQFWDYSWAAAYFITITTKQKIHYFGYIERGRMNLSQAGVVADLLWYDILNHTSFAELGAFVVMPNHIHGILILNNPEQHNQSISFTEARKKDIYSLGETRFQNPGKGTVSTIVGGYKSAVTRNCNRLGFNFAWKPSFYEHIIRSERAYNNITNYIINNPAKWENDRFYSK